MLKRLFMIILPLCALFLALTLVLPAAKYESAFAASDSVGPRTQSGGEDPPNGIYVSPTGNDATANGSISAPYRRINTALAAAQPGDTIILRGGVYQEGTSVRVRKPNITIKSARGEWAIIDLTTIDDIYDENSGVEFDVDSAGGKLQNVEVMGGFYAVCIETTFRWNPADPFSYGASNIIIEDCVLHDSKYDVVKVKPNCNNVTIRYNEIYNSGQAFTDSIHNGEENAEGIDNVNGNNMTVQNNYIHDIISNAIYAKGGARDALIENNWIELAYGAGIMLGFDTSPDWFDLTVNPQYYENIRGIVRNNLIVDTCWEGIGLYAALDAQVYNNTLINVDNGRWVHSAIYFGITMQDWDDEAGRPATLNPHIHHNIVCQPASFDRQMIEIRYNNELGGVSALAGNPLMHDNCYYIAGRNAYFTDNRPGSTLQNARFSAWQAHISGDAGSLEADPALDANYMPTNPLCIGMGYTLGLPPSPTYRATVNPGACVFPSAAIGYNNASMTQTFTITNTGNQPLTNLTASLAGHNFEVSATLSASTIPLSGAATIGIRPQNALTDGSYNDTLTLRWDNDGGAGLVVSLSFTVGNAANSPTLTLAAAPAASQVYPGNVVLTATLSQAAPDNAGKRIVFTVNGSSYTETTNASGIATHTVASPAPGLYSFGASFAGDAENAPAAAPGITGYSVTEDITPGQTYDIADFYWNNGRLTVQRGDIIVVGERRYRVLANTYTIEYWSQGSLNSAISWWTGYMNSFAEGGVVEEMSAAITASGIIRYQPSPVAATVTLYDSAGESSAATGQDGSYAISAPAGIYSLKVTKPGYLSYTVHNYVFGGSPELETIDISQLAGDVNGDGIVNSIDLTYLLSEFNRTPLQYPAADINGDGIVNSVDLTYLLAGFNKRNVEYTMSN